MCIFILIFQIEFVASKIDRDDFDLSVLEPLAEIDLTLLSEAEIIKVKSFLAKKENTQGKCSILQFFFSNRSCGRSYHLLKAVETFASSTATSECSFSALSKMHTV